MGFWIFMLVMDLLIPVTVIVLTCVFGKGNNCVGNVGGIVCTLQCVVIIGTIVVTERELKKRFDRNGRVRRD